MNGRPAGGLRSVSRSPFPVSAHANGRYVVNAKGQPFPLLVRVCWMITRLSQANYEAVLDDTAAKSFTAIECKPPLAPDGYQFDASGNLPFLKNLAGGDWDGQVIPYSNISTQAPDFTTPNPAFWSGIDTFFRQVERRGLAALYFGAYVGFENTDWWLDMMVANGATKMQTYGAWLADRYRGQRNIVWMLGGDMGTDGHTFDSSETAVVTAFNNGLKSVVTVAREYSAEWVRGSIAKDLFASDITLNGTYGSGNADTTHVNNQGARAWATSPPVPAFLQEGPFEEIGSPGIVRRFNYWGWMTTGGGYSFGNGVFTDFTSGVYTSHMNTQGTLDAARMNRYIRSINWHLLEPANSIITAGAGTANSDSHAVAMLASDRSMALVYRPPGNTNAITVDMSQLAGSANARFFDPTNETFTAGESGLAASGTHQFTFPGNNSAGDPDYLLELKVA